MTGGTGYARDLVSAGAGANIAPEGPIAISGSGIELDPGDPGRPSLVTGAPGHDAIPIPASDVLARGGVFAPAGGVQLTGSRGSSLCGIRGETIRVGGFGH